MDINIRSESVSDEAAIYNLTKRAFAPMPYSDGDEQDLINRLRDAGELLISLVAEQNNIIIGHIAFSPAYTADGDENWFALGPVAVEPELQRQNIGAKLVEKGIELLEERDAAGCILVGNPDYYSRFGFNLYPKLAPKGQPSEYFMILPLGIAEPQAIIDFHPLFTA